jgi:hypothetical protein
MSEPETLLPIGELAARLTEPGLPPAPIATQLRNYAQRNLIHSFGVEKGSGRTAYRLYREDQWLSAKVLGLLTEAGYADLSVLNAASLALNAWPIDSKALNAPEKVVAWMENPPARSPAQWVIDDFRKGINGWTFDLVVFRHFETGDRQVRARIHNMKDGRGTSYGLSDEYLPLTMTVIDLQPHLKRLFGEG